MHVAGRRTHQGFGLIELMVALVIGLLLVLVATSAYLQTASGARFAVQQAQMNGDAAIALDTLAAQIRVAGASAQGADGKRVFRDQALLACDGGFTGATATAAFGLLRCNNSATANDAVALRYQADALNTATLADGTTPSNCTGLGLSRSPVNGANVYLADNRFYIANDNTNDNKPTLYCRGATGAATMGAAAALVPNVESLQIRLALTRAPVVGEIAPHQITAWVPPSHPLLAVPGGEWGRVAGIDICIVMRSDTSVARDGLTMNEVTGYLDCADQFQTAQDGRLRRAYRTTLWLGNLRPALPLPHERDGATALFPYRHL